MSSGTARSAPDRPRVSVVMPVWNAERYVEEAVESILAQSLPEFELLVFDDGSSDASPALLAAARDRDPRVRLSLGEHRGLTEWLAKGVAEARGEYLARMDADDVAYTERLARQVAYLDAHPECVAVGSEALRVDPERRPLGLLGVPRTHEEIDAAFLSGRGHAILHPASMVRREAVLAVGGYRAAYETAEDLDLFLRLAERGRLANLPEVCLEYRQHLGKVSGTRKGEQRRVQQAVLREACLRRGLGEAAVPRRPPLPERDSPADTWQRWACWAIEAGHLATARRYAWKLWRAEPFAPRAWKLAARALLTPAAAPGPAAGPRSSGT